MSIIAKIKSRCCGFHGRRVLASLRNWLSCRDSAARACCFLVLKRFFCGDDSVRADIMPYMVRFFGQPSSKSTEPCRVSYIIQTADGPEQSFETEGGSLTSAQQVSAAACFEELLYELRDLILEHLQENEVVEIHSAGGRCYLGPSSPATTTLLKLVLGVQELYSEGPYEEGPVVVSPGDVVIDCGAHIGVFSIWAAKKGAQVHAFEPCRSLISVLERNLALNKCTSQVTIHPNGVAQNHCRFDFVERSGAISSSGLASVSAAGVGADTVGSVCSYPVECVTLDELVEQNKVSRVDFIKSDIEGAERQMLTGAQATLARFAPKLAICTYHFPEDRELLTSIIRNANPQYRFSYSSHKLYAWVD